MTKSGLKALLATLSKDEQRDLVLVYMRWMNQQALVAYERGEFAPKTGSIESVTTIHPRTLALLDEALATNDAKKVLVAGVTEIVRGLNHIQRSSEGPKLNTFLRAHLSARIRRTLYDSVGLDLGSLQYDADFPTARPERDGSRDEAQD